MLQEIYKNAQNDAGESEKVSPSIVKRSGLQLSISKTQTKNNPIGRGRDPSPHEDLYLPAPEEVRCSICWGSIHRRNTRVQFWSDHCRTGWMRMERDEEDLELGNRRRKKKDWGSEFLIFSPDFWSLIPLSSSEGETCKFVMVSNWTAGELFRSEKNSSSLDIYFKIGSLYWSEFSIFLWGDIYPL